jgi:hypothetical protein
MRLSSANNVNCTRFASHPQLAGVCVRIDGPKALIMWSGGHMEAPITKIPTSWWIPADDLGRRLPMRIRRPLLGAKYNVVDVEFLAPAKRPAHSSLPSGRPFWAPFLLSLFTELSSSKKG